MSDHDFDVSVVLFCLFLTAIGVGFWQQSIGAGIAVFFGAFTITGLIRLMR